MQQFKRHDNASESDSIEIRISENESINFRL